MEDDLNFFDKWKMTLIFLVYRWRPQLFWQMEDNLNMEDNLQQL